MGHLRGDKFGAVITALSDPIEKYRIGRLVALFIQLLTAIITETALKQGGNRATALWIPVRVNKPAHSWLVSADIVFRHTTQKSLSMFQVRLSRF